MPDLTHFTDFPPLTPLACGQSRTHTFNFNSASRLARDRRGNNPLKGVEEAKLPRVKPQGRHMESRTAPYNTEVKVD